MNNQSNIEVGLPLVSVVVPCYNHGAYLQEAISSIWQQNYHAIEIIVVDDGSKDNTKEVTHSNAGVHYVYQQNQGLSAARNTGIRYSTGDFLIFLDADDWLLPDAIQTNVAYMQQHLNLAFVSGGHLKVFVDEGTVKESVSKVQSNHYIHLLQGNYIGMHATVMYRRFVFENFTFDVSLKACEDYDMYLKVARKYSVLHHTAIIAAYRQRANSMSSNIPFMLNTVTKVLDRQKKLIKNGKESQALRNGYKIWKNYYCMELYNKLISKRVLPYKEMITMLIKYKPTLAIKYFLKSFFDVKNSC